MKYRMLMGLIAATAGIQVAGVPRAEAALNAYLVFNAPGAGTGAGQGTVTTCGNENDQLTGYYVDSQNIRHGFVANRTGNAIDVLAWSWGVTGSGVTATEGNCINNNGVIAGDYTDASGVTHGLQRAADGTLTAFDAPGTGIQATVPTAIADDGTMVGYYEDANSVYHGFTRAPSGTIETIDAPGAGNAAGQGTLAHDISRDGVIQGQIYDKKGAAHSWVRAPWGTFATANSSLACEQAGFGTFTSPQGLNDSGEIGGQYRDANGTMHGYTANPSVSNQLAYFDAPGAGTGNYAGTYVDAVNWQGQVAGRYYDDKGQGHVYVRGYPSNVTYDLLTLCADTCTGASGGEDRLTENVSLNFSRVSLHYAASGTTVDKNNVKHGFTYDIAANKME
jgi:hypothetical protein